MTVKIQCGCGQRYAFDVEPLDGRLPAPVQCPACGADGTAAADHFIQQSLQDLSAVPSTPSPRLTASRGAELSSRRTLNTQQQRGRSILLGYMTMLLLCSLGTTVVYILIVGPERVLAQTVRLGLTAGLLVWVYLGGAVAKWITVGLLGIGGLMGLGVLLTGWSIVAVLALILTALYWSFAYVLIASESVNAFLGYQQGSATLH